MFKKFSSYLPDLKESWLLFIITVFLGSLFAGIIYMPLLQVFPGSGFIQKDLSYILMFVPAVLFILIRIKKQSGRTDPFTPVKSVPLNAPDFGKVNPVLFFIVLLFTGIAFPIAYDPIASTDLMTPPEWFTRIMDTMVGGKFLPAFIAVSLMAPLCEEFLCRGIIARGLLEHTTPAKAIFWSALIFAVLHLNPWQGLAAFLLGSFFGWIYYRTHSLWATMFLHFVNNTLALVMTVIFPDMESTATLKDMMPNAASYWIMVAASLAVLVAAIIYLNKKLASEYVQE